MYDDSRSFESPGSSRRLITGIMMTVQPSQGVADGRVDQGHLREGAAIRNITTVSPFDQGAAEASHPDIDTAHPKRAIDWKSNSTSIYSASISRHTSLFSITIIFQNVVVSQIIYLLSLYRFLQVFIYLSIYLFCCRCRCSLKNSSTSLSRWAVSHSSGPLCLS